MDPQDRPGRRERRAAATLVKRACAAGRIVAADRDLRLVQVEQATTNAELAVLTRDLTQPGGVAPAPTSAPSVAVPPLPPARTARVLRSNPFSGYAARRTGGGRAIVPIVVLAVVLAVIVPVIGSAVALIGSFRSATRSDPSSGPSVEVSEAAVPEATRESDVLTRPGLVALLGALRSETGATRVSMAAMYEDYAVIEAEGRDGRAHTYRWGGTLVDLSSRGAAPATKDVVDLGRIGSVVLLRALRLARAMQPQADQFYVLVRPASGDGAVVYGYALGEGDGASAYVATTADGKVVRKVGF